MAWTDSIILPLEGKTAIDDDGFEITTTTNMEAIPANFKDVTRRDAELAQQFGYDATMNIDIMSVNYAGQRTLVDESTGETYYIQREYRHPGRDLITLTVGRRERGGRI